MSPTTEHMEIPIPDLLWQSCDGMMVIDERRRILAMNPALERMTGCKTEEAVGKSECGLLFACRDFRGCPLHDQPRECPGLRAAEELRPVQAAEYTIRGAGGKGVVVSTSYTPIQFSGQPVWVLAILRDITLQKRREIWLTQQAKTDPLTGLPNRAALNNLLERELRRADRFHHSLGIAMADLDGFKAYNDLMGHLAGDDLLKSLAGLLQSGRRMSDFIARYGGDEFALLMPETDAAGAMVVAERLVQVVAHFPFAQGNAPVASSLLQSIGTSIGVAVFPEDGRETHALLEKADQRLYEAKRLGGNQVVGPT